MLIPAPWDAEYESVLVWEAVQMSVKVQNFTIYTADTRLVTVTVKDPSKAPVDLTGMLLTWKARLPGIEDSGLTKSTTDGTITLLDQTQTPGQCQFRIESQETEFLEVNTYPHQLRVEDPANGGAVVLKGDMTVELSL